jgi:trans-aconitate methyltransferase
MVGGDLYQIVSKYTERPSILDLGCGTGAKFPLLPDAYRHYHGVDISGEAIKRARALKRPHTSYETADILHYEPQESYDAILLIEVLNYLPTTKIVQFLRRLSAFLTPGGVMIIQIWDGAENHRRLTAAIKHTGMVMATVSTSATDTDSSRNFYILGTGEHTEGE